MRKASLIAVLICLQWHQVFALSEDKQQPIRVEADNLEIRDKENISIYKGNVKLMQGSLEIRSKHLVIHFNAAKELILMEMTGSPATFRQLDEDRKEMLGRANLIQYTATDSVLILQDNAMFTHDGDTIESNKIRIDTESNAIEAGSSQANNRVHMTIQPKQPQ